MPPYVPGRARALLLSSMLLAALSVGSSAPRAFAAPTLNGKLQVIHLDAGQGDAAVIITPGGRVAMIDDGTNFASGSSGASCGKVLTQLQALGITHIDLHFASHYHADHIGCITSFPGITIAAGWDRGQSYTTTTYNNYVSYLTGKRFTLTKGQVITLDSLSAHPVRITCVALAGDGISTSDENSKCLVLKVSYGEFDEVFGGDLTGNPSGSSSSNTNIETKVGPQVGRVEAYKVHHHGSAGASYDDWLNATMPKIGIISCGAGNGYGHPTSAALTRLHIHGVRTYWTENGAASGATPDPIWDKVASNMIRINAVWQPGGVDSILAPGIADTLTNSGTAVDGTPPVVLLTTPNGGDTLTAGVANNVLWNASDNVGVTNVDLDYSLDDGTNWVSIAVASANSGSFAWAVPNTPTTLGRVRVTAHDAAGNTGAVLSASAFVIADRTSPLATVVAPNGGESYLGASTQTIKWTTSDNVGIDSVTVAYSLQGVAGPWSRIAQTVAAGTDSVSWTIPGAATDSGLVRVTAYDHALNQAVDLGDAFFHITQPVLSVGGGDRFLALALYRPSPNPGHGQVTLRFAMPSTSVARLDMVDVAGRRVWGRDFPSLSAGEYRVSWDGHLSGGGIAPAGAYFVRLETGLGQRTTRFVWLN